MKHLPLFIALAFLAFVGSLSQCAHAQQGSWGIPRSAFSTVRTPDPVPVVRSEERITTMAQARRAAER